MQITSTITIISLVIKPIDQKKKKDPLIKIILYL